jgi:hypothetical protein
MSNQLLESVDDDLGEARARIARTREALERALEGSDDPMLRETVARLERKQADVERLAVVQAGSVAN